jgi:hypothetical protein
VAVHYVEVHEIGTPSLGGGDLLTEPGEVRGENRGRKPSGHRLTSSEMGSPGAIWNPPGGLWRMTTPAGTPGYG